MAENHWKLETTGTASKMKFVGTIDGSFQFPDVSLFKSAQGIEIDLTDFKSMNSEGIRTWIQWHGQLNPSVQMTYVKAPSIFINLASIISGLISEATCLKSFTVNYSSPDGKKTVKRLIEQTPEGHFFIAKEYQGLELDHFPIKEFRVLNGHYTLT